MRKTFTLLLCLSSLFKIFGQSTLQGTVVEGRTSQSLEFATVSLYLSGDSSLISGTISDVKGKFLLKDLKPGNYYLLIQFLGYNVKKIPNLTIAAGKSVDIGAVNLEGNERLLNEVIVQGEKAGTVHKIDKQIYKAAQFQSSQGGTATDVLKNLPSVSVNSEGDITMRGSSSFIVLLDGKPIQSEPSVLLNQLPANTIENVEIITTPSSKYDPDGKAGIINITTKKGSTDGLYLIANGQLGAPSIQDYGNHTKPQRFGGDFTANYKQNKWNLSVGANYKREDIAGYREGEAQTFLNNTFTTFPSLGERSYKSYAYSFKGTANYAINKFNSFDAGFYAGKKSQFRTADIVYHQKRFNESTGELLNSYDYYNKNLRERKGDFVTANLGYNHIFQDQSSIAFSTLYEKTILGGPTNNRDVNPEQESQLYTHSIMDEDNPLDGFRFKADYAKPVTTKAKFEAGYQYRYLLHKGKFAYNQLDLSTNTWNIRPELSNQIELTRQIHSLYGLYTGEIGTLNYSAGLRAEYTDRVLNEKGNPDPYKFKRLNLFPSANFLYAIGNGYKLKAGYSRRIVHNTSNMMNPFLARRHSEVLEVGDPNLLPEYIDVAEIGAIKEIGTSSIFATLYYQGTKNVINRVNSIYNDTILIRTYTNAGNATSFGVELGTDLKVTKWWSLYAGGNVYNYTIKGGVLDNRVNRNSVNYSFNANTTFKFSSTLSLQLNVNYTSRTVTAQGHDSRFLIPNASLKKTLLDGRGSISLQWQNIDLGFSESNEQVIATRTRNFYSSTNYIQEVDIIRINFSYQLNKLARKVKFTESEFGEKEF